MGHLQQGGISYRIYCTEIGKGIELINQLNQILLSEGKYDELQKASKDKEYQKKLLAEYGLLNEKQGE